MSHIKALVLDIGAVLIQLDFSQIMQLRGLGSPDLETSLVQMNQWPLYDLFERGEISESRFIEAIENNFHIQIAREHFLKIWNSVLRETVPGIPELLTKIAKQIPLYALTNSNSTHIEYAKKNYPWLNQFKTLFTSYDLGARKPEIEIYRKVSEAINIEPSRILFVDDRIENVSGARSAGWIAEVCHSSPTDLFRILQKYQILVS